MAEFPWYSTVPTTDRIEQGDFINSCPIIEPPELIKTNSVNDLTADEYDVIVMTQTCDLVYAKVNIVLVCPFYTLAQLSEKNKSYRGRELRENLRRGNIPRYHLLDKLPGKNLEDDCVVVDFGSVFGVHKKFLDEFRLKIGDRTRLLPPYREHLSQAFARFFMRVGLPIDIPPFKS